MQTERGNALPKGSQLQSGRYLIEVTLGEGGFGITYRANDTKLHRTVAIKELYPGGSERAGDTVTIPAGYTPSRWHKVVTDFIREAETLASLDHSAIVPVYDYFEENGTAYMVMRFIDGMNLVQRMKQYGAPLPEDEAVRYIAQIGEALVVVHSRGLLHRDIKPSNIMLDQRGRVVLIDFGSAREFVPDQSITQTVVATYGFAPPEQFYLKAPRGPFTDIYALAATCYYLLTGTLPNADPEADQRLRPPMLAALDHAMSYKAEERPHDVDSFLDELLAATPAAADAMNTSRTVAVVPLTNTPSTPLDSKSQPPARSVIITPPPAPRTARPTAIVPPLTAAPAAGLLASDPTARKRTSPLLFIIGGIAGVALLVILALLVLNRNGGDATASNNLALVVTNTPTLVAAPLASNTPIIAAQNTVVVVFSTPTAAPQVFTDTPLHPTASLPPVATVTTAPLPPTNTPLPPIIVTVLVTAPPPPPLVAQPSYTPLPLPTHTPRLRPSNTPIPTTSPPTNTPPPTIPPPNTPLPSATPIPTPSNTPMPVGCNKQGRPVNGFDVDGEFYFFWCTNGGGGVFGNPISQVNNNSGRYPDVSRYQWFDYARLEWHPSYGSSGAVSTGALGVEDMKAHGYADTDPHFLHTTASGQGIYFPQTGHNVAHGFLQRFIAYGGQDAAVALFGYPISEEFNEGGTIVQYFQRTVFEVQGGVVERAVGRELMP